MLNVDEARTIIAEKTAKLDVETVRFEEALGRVLREPVVADTDQPPFDRSAMDGYAIRADDSVEKFKIVAVVRAGDVPSFSPQPGECARIFTGAQIPSNTGVVIRQEDTEVADGTMRVKARDRGTNIRKRGEDVKAGATLISPSDIPLNPALLSVMAGVGHVRVQVTRKPRVLHLSSGNELVTPDQKPGPGQIRDSNSILVKGLVEQAGAEMTGQLHTGDDLEEIMAVARGFTKPYDVLLFSGGASVGDFDYAAATLENLGFTIHFRQINVRPGKPLIFATNGAQIAFGLPGNPVSHFVTFHLFVRTALRGMLGYCQTGPEFVGAHLWRDYTDPPNARETYAPAQWFCPDGVKNHVQPIPWQSSGHLTSLVAANGLLHVPANVAGMKKGDLVEVITI